jgi:hypothetical protein
LGLGLLLGLGWIRMKRLRMRLLVRRLCGEIAGLCRCSATGSSRRSAVLVKALNASCRTPQCRLRGSNVSRCTASAGCSRRTITARPREGRSPGSDCSRNRCIDAR